MHSALKKPVYAGPILSASRLTSSTILACPCLFCPASPYLRSGVNSGYVVLIYLEAVVLKIEWRGRGFLTSTSAGSCSNRAIGSCDNPNGLLPNAFAASSINSSA